MLVIIFLCIILLISGFAICVAIKNKDLFMGSVFTLFAIAAIIILCLQFKTPDKLILSSKEYTLKKQLNILDNQVDTTYILTYDSRN